MKTELSPDKLYYKSKLSGLKRFLMDKTFDIEQLIRKHLPFAGQVAYSCLGITAALAVHGFWKSTEPLETRQHVTAKTLTNAIKNPALR